MNPKSVLYHKAYSGTLGYRCGLHIYLSDLVLAALDDAVYDREPGQATLRYPAGQVIKAPRLSAFKAWTANNCVMPLELERG